MEIARCGTLPALGQSRVRVPSVEAEDGRQPHRELGSLKRERTRHINRIKGLLAGQGIRMGIGKEFARDLDKVRLWDGSALGPGLRARLVREFERMELLRQQVRELEQEQREALRHSTRPEMAKVRDLVRLKGIGITSAWLYTMELPRPECPGRALPGERSAIGESWEPWPD